MPSFKTHPLTGQPLAPVYTDKYGVDHWPILGASEPAGVETITVPAPATPTPVTVPAGITQEALEAALAQARREEKDKLYPDLAEARAKLSEFDAFKAEVEATQAAAVEAAQKKAREEAEAEARKKWEESDAKTLIAAETERLNNEWSSRFQNLEEERANERALFAKEQEFQHLKEYATGKVTAAIQALEIAPELSHFVSGNTEAEIDASLETVKATSQQMLESIRQATQQTRAAMPGVSTAGYAATGPMDIESGTKTFTNEDLKAMSMTEFGKYREGLLGKAVAAGQSNRGMFG